MEWAEKRDLRPWRLVKYLFEKAMIRGRRIFANGSGPLFIKKELSRRTAPMEDRVKFRECTAPLIWVAAG